ncbi:LLM class flavin-dependent oxidoreductase, partial [Pseudomonas sp. P7548]|nr:LLM class flavin-dependent oxidoreductase [Pseudomonas sp. P7548]
VPFEAVRGKENYNPDNIRRNLMFGTPDEIIAKLLDYEAAGVDQYCLGLTFNLPFELQKQTLRLFIDEVMPVFAERERVKRRETVAG